MFLPMTRCLMFRLVAFSIVVWATSAGCVTQHRMKNLIASLVSSPAAGHEFIAC